MLLRAINNAAHGKDSTLQIWNKEGDIDFLLREATGQPTARGIFSISKSTATTPAPLLTITPGTTTDTITLDAHTTINGPLTVTGDLLLDGSPVLNFDEVANWLPLNHGVDAMIWGPNATGSGTFTISIGAGSISNNSISIGNNAVSGSGVTGSNVSDAANRQLYIPSSWSGGANGIALGKSTFAGADAVALGTYAAARQSAFAGGFRAQAFGQESVALGSGAASRGTASVAIGKGALASGNQAVALGSSIAAGIGSFSAGYGDAHGIGSFAGGFAFADQGGVITARPRAQGLASFAYGHGFVAAYGDYSFAFGTGTSEVAGTAAEGNFSFAMGKDNVASGDYSMSFGYAAYAFNHHSLAFGDYTGTEGMNSLVFGTYVWNWGDYSVSFGEELNSIDAHSFIVGRYNQDVTPAQTGNRGSDWNPETALFVLANGSSPSQRSNAFVVRKNGNTEVKGTSLKVNGFEVLTEAALLTIQANIDDAVENVNLGTGNYISRNPTIAMTYGLNSSAAAHSVALGEGAEATGTQSSSAVGYETTASQAGTHALGNHVVANLPGQVVIGNYNSYGTSSGTAAPEDPVFVIGNGTADNARSNAMTIRRNGGIELTGSTLTWNAQALLTQTDASTTYLTVTAAAAQYQAKPEGETEFLTSEDLFSIQADIEDQIDADELATALANLSPGQGGTNYLSKDPQVGLAYGTGSVASAPSSSAVGEHVVANQTGQVVVGSYNEYQTPGSTPVPEDAVFVVGVGNGVAADPEERKNALVVKRNGDVSVSGVLRVKPAGNLLMGDFDDGPEPGE